ncbi:MAG TPA: aldolase/citrate lyase family protein [Verrucomicrobiae bacterium]|nr:aldolase/citrate lyase family protein [Verrucomicrobiae bacterium]
MGQTKRKLALGNTALGGWIMIGHPSVAEIMAGEGFDWIAVDLEHTSTSLHDLQAIAMALKGSECDLLVRLHSCDAVQAKLVLDIGADGIIVPAVNTPAQAAQAAAIARFPPEGIRGASLCRATDFGRNFKDYFEQHNRKVIVVVMLENHVGVAQADAILSTPGVDAAFIGPYDLSASMGLAGQLEHADVLAAQQKVLAACVRHGVAPGIHVVSTDPDDLKQCLDQGFRFVACGLDTLFIQRGCRRMKQPSGISNGKTTLHPRSDGSPNGETSPTINNLYDTSRKNTK